MTKILETGDLQHTEVRHNGWRVSAAQTEKVRTDMCHQTGERQGPKNDSMGTRSAH